MVRLVSTGVLEVCKQASLGDGWDVYRVGAMTAAGTFTGYCIGAVVESVPLLIANYKEYRGKRFFEEVMNRPVVEKKHENS